MKPAEMIKYHERLAEVEGSSGWGDSGKYMLHSNTAKLLRAAEELAEVVNNVIMSSEEPLHKALEKYRKAGGKA